MTLRDFEGWILFAAQVHNMYDRLLWDLGWPYELERNAVTLEDHVHQLHFYNSSLWNEEDLARRTAAPPDEIVKNKRTIDRFNQLRNDRIEKIDDLFLSNCSVQETLYQHAHRNSETAGSLFDRASIVSLKIFHMTKQVQRPDVDETHRRLAAERVAILNEQRTDLIESLRWLLEGLSAGTAYFKIYRQFKMYNDPDLNPALIAEGGKSDF